MRSGYPFQRSAATETVEGVLAMKARPSARLYCTRDHLHVPLNRFCKKLKKDKIILVGVEWSRQLQDEEA